MAANRGLLWPELIKILLLGRGCEYTTKAIAYMCDRDPIVVYRVLDNLRKKGLAVAVRSTYAGRPLLWSIDWEKYG